jgi:hypothetical protein
LNILSASTNVSNLRFEHIDPLVADTPISQLEFWTPENDGSSNYSARFGMISAVMADRAVVNTEDGSFKFALMFAGTPDTEFMTMNDLGNGNIEILKPLDIQDVDIIVGTATGTKLGTSTTQKLGFWNATPIVQPTHIADATDAASVITQLNALLAQLATMGLQAAA